MLFDERWAVIRDFPNYEVSNTGHIRRTDTGRYLKPYESGANGNRQVHLWEDGDRRARSVHRLVAEYFLPGNKEGYHIRNIDGDLGNCHVNNLEINVNRRTVVAE